MSTLKQPPKFVFATSPITSPFGCRLGTITLDRTLDLQLKIHTPGLLVSTSRGVVPHLTRDHTNLTAAIRWINIPFESFLEQSPPLPTVYPGSHPLHDFPGYLPDKHIVSMSARDPSDGQELPANGKDNISVRCIRGVKKLTPSIWRSYVLASNPDFVVALSDTPFTSAPYSQKRLTKSIERSAAWLSDILRPLSAVDCYQRDSQLNVLVHMAGGGSISARQAFSNSLLETLHDQEADVVKPFKTLDEGVAGYLFDLVPLRDSLPHPISDDHLVELIQSSLLPLPTNKLRIANTVRSPHDILHLIQRIGIDIFDSYWVQRAAGVGIALDFHFPVCPSTSAICTEPRTRQNGKRDVGHNLYDQRYVHDFSRFAQTFLDGASYSPGCSYCPCAGCSPLTPTSQLRHSSVDEYQLANSPFQPPYTRAYLHHLLHTHEMSAHAFMVMHNLSILDAFFDGIRKVIEERGPVAFEEEVRRFVEYYDETMTLVDEATTNWKEVDLARGKGRMAREKKNITAPAVAD